jgi:hypothetical protein
MKVTRTITIDGDTNQEYVTIVAHMETLHTEHPEWELIKDPLANRVTAVKVEDVDGLD